jgi:beta-glucanase (GH16 family)
VFYNYNYVDDAGNLRSSGQRQLPAEGLSESFHTIALNWTPEELVFYIDGQPSYRIVGDDVPAEDMYLILNLAMGGVWPGAPDATTPDPATFKVDYIRVFQLLNQ